MDEDYVLPVNITEFLKLSLERFVPRAGNDAGSEKSNLRYLPRPLRLGRKAKPKEHGAKRADNKFRFCAVAESPS
jgi:hypothetical protein